MQNNLMKPLEYTELRTCINELLSSFFNYEFDLVQHGEYDWETEESYTDDILRLIRRQGGQV